MDRFTFALQGCHGAGAARGRVAERIARGGRGVRQRVDVVLHRERDAPQRAALVGWLRLKLSVDARREIWSALGLGSASGHCSGGPRSKWVGLLSISGARNLRASCMSAASAKLPPSPQSEHQAEYNRRTLCGAAGLQASRAPRRSRARRPGADGAPAAVGTASGTRRCTTPARCRGWAD